MDRLQRWGVSLIIVCGLKLVATPLIGVRPDTANLSVTLAGLTLGGLLIFGSYLQGHRRQRIVTDRQPERSIRTSASCLRCRKS